MAFPLIRQFNFVSFYMGRHYIYKHILEYAQQSPSDKIPVFLDLGCCSEFYICLSWASITHSLLTVGTDLRKLLQDGYPASRSPPNVYGSDILLDFITEGYKLYKDGPGRPSPTPIKFFADEIFNIPPKADGVTPVRPVGLNSLRGKVDILYAGALFHVFAGKKQYGLAQRIVALINTNYSAERKNSETIIFGRHMGSQEPTKNRRPKKHGGAFDHSPSSWHQLWETVLVEAFGTGILQNVEIHAELVEEWLLWSVVLRLPLNGL